MSHHVGHLRPGAITAASMPTPKSALATGLDDHVAHEHGGRTVKARHCGHKVSRLPHRRVSSGWIRAQRPGQVAHVGGRRAGRGCDPVFRVSSILRQNEGRNRL